MFSVALLLTVPGLISQTAKAQLNELVPEAKEGLASCSQVPPNAPGASLLTCLDLEIPRFALKNSAYAFFELVNLDQRVDQTDDRSTDVLASLPHADAPSQILSVVRVDADSPGTPSAAPPQPDPPNPSDGGWHFGIAPYLWFAGIHGTVGALGHEGSVHASFHDIFSHFNIGLMFALEPRYNRIVMPLDFMWMKVSDDKALPFEVGPMSVKAKINEIMLTQKIGYRLIDTEKFKVDGLAGFRYWHMGNTLTLHPQIGNGFYASANWVDAVGGARFQALLGPKVIFTVLGDAGGGGANSDYQVAGLLGWKFKKFDLQGGWRYMSVNYRPNGSVRFVYDMATSGLILGVTIPLK
ncbi:MAG TPA: hypothetical protein VJO16_02555 [Candidatus Acidoferrum sp.]|nr:hypothetical protein [Candidatus Acidoferrum sp.]